MGINEYVDSVAPIRGGKEIKEEIINKLALSVFVRYYDGKPKIEMKVEEAERLLEKVEETKIEMETLMESLTSMEVRLKKFINSKGENSGAQSHPELETLRKILGI